MNPRIGVYSDSYPDYRMILNKVPEYSYVQVTNRRDNLGRGLRLTGKAFPGLRQTEFYAQGVHFTLDAPYYPNVDVIHTFNRVCLHDRNRWIATFEKTFPEYFSEENRINIKKMKKQLPLILSDKCIAILPMSRWAYEYELWLLSQFSSLEEIRQVEKKMSVLYPPQGVLISREEIERKIQNAGTIRFLFVGSQVKRKGGAEVLKVFQAVHQSHPNFSLVFIGNLNGNYNRFYLTEEEREEIESIIHHSAWLEYHEKVSNEEVLRLAKHSHIGLLPSMGDTFGFSVLEMQACGCPVITTDRQALPEINNDQCGWLLDTKTVELAHGDDFAHYTREEVDTLSACIKEQLYKTVVKIMDNPDMIFKKAIYAEKRIREDHSPDVYSSRLKEYYDRASKRSEI